MPTNGILLARMPHKKKIGETIIPLGVYPERHELETAAVFLLQGLDVQFLQPSNTRKSKTPDVMIGGVEWEIKAPTGGSRYTIQNQFKRAVKQSKNIILDVRRVSLRHDFIQTEIEKELRLRRSIKRLKVILKSNEILDSHKR